MEQKDNKIVLSERVLREMWLRLVGFTQEYTQIRDIQEINKPIEVLCRLNENEALVNARRTMLDTILLGSRKIQLFIDLFKDKIELNEAFIHFLNEFDTGVGKYNIDREHLFYYIDSSDHRMFHKVTEIMTGMQRRLPSPKKGFIDMWKNAAKRSKVDFSEIDPYYFLLPQADEKSERLVEKILYLKNFSPRLVQEKIEDIFNNHKNIGVQSACQAYFQHHRIKFEEKEVNCLKLQEAQIYRFNITVKPDIFMLKYQVSAEIAWKVSAFLTAFIATEDLQSKEFLDRDKQGRLFFETEDKALHDKVKQRVQFVASNFLDNFLTQENIQDIAQGYTSNRLKEEMIADFHLVVQRAESYHELKKKLSEKGNTRRGIKI